MDQPVTTGAIDNKYKAPECHAKNLQRLIARFFIGCMSFLFGNKYCQSRKAKAIHHKNIIKGNTIPNIMIQLSRSLDSHSYADPLKADINLPIPMTTRCC